MAMREKQSLARAVGTKTNSEVIELKFGKKMSYGDMHFKAL